jgi:hypothetical protein
MNKREHPFQTKVTSSTTAEKIGKFTLRGHLIERKMVYTIHYEDSRMSLVVTTWTREDAMEWIRNQKEV